MAIRTVANAGGNWSATGTWNEGAVPTAADEVVVTATSGAVTIDVASACRSLNLTGYLSTLTHAAGITLSIGDGTAPTLNKAVVFPTTGWTYTLGSTSTSKISLVSTVASTTVTCDFGGKALPSLTVNGAATTTHQLTGNGFTQAAAATLTLTQGTFDTNGLACTWGILATTAVNTFGLTLGASAISILGVGTISAGGTFTLTPGTSNITLVAGSRLLINYTGLTFYDFTFAGGGQAGFQGSAALITCHNLTITGTGSTDQFLFGTNVTMTNSLTVNGTSAGARILVASGASGLVSPGTTVTITAAATTITNTDFMDIAGAGAAAPFTGTILGDCGGNSGITFTVAATQTHTASAGGSFSNALKWTSRSPLPQDDVIVDVNTTGTLTFDRPRLGKSIDFTGFVGTATFTNGGWVHGSITFGIGMTISGIATLQLVGRGSFTITSNTRTTTTPITIEAPGGTYTLADDLTVNAQIFTVNSGTFTAANKNISALSYTLAAARTPTVNPGTGTWTTTGTAAGSVFSCPAGVTWNGGSETIKITVATANARIFTGGAHTYGTLDYTVAGSTGKLTVNGSNSFAAIKFSDATNARTLEFAVGATTTITAAAGWLVNGTAGKLMSIVSATGGSAWNLVLTGGGIVNSDYLSIKDSHASPAITWFAGGNSTNVSGNTGWVFAVGVVGTDTGTGTDTTGTITVSTTDMGSGTDANGTIVISTTDVMSGADNQWITLTEADTGSGADLNSTLAVLGTDVGSAVDLQSLVTVASAEAVSGTDSQSSVGVSTADTGTGSELQGIMVEGADDGAGLDVEQLIALFSSDDGAGDDSEAVNFYDSDTASGVDAESMITVMSSDDGVGSETEIVFVVYLISRRSRVMLPVEHGDARGNPARRVMLPVER